MPGELKFEGLTDAAKGQIMNCMRLGLKLNPARAFIYGFLTNTRQFIFFKAYRDVKNCVRYMESCIYDRQEGLRNLVRMLISPPNLHGIPSNLPKNLNPTRCLGTGATSHFFEATYQSDTDCGVKWFKEDQELAFENEQDRLLQLQTYRQQMDNSSTESFVPILEFAEFPFLVMKPVGKPVLAKLAETRHLLTKNFVHKFIQAVKHVHDAGIIHRDIRPENIVVLENGDPMLIDFGFAVSAPFSPISYAGTLTFASARILELRKQDETAKITPEYTDDLESVFKVCYFLKHQLPYYYLREDVNWSTFELVYKAVTSRNYEALEEAIVAYLRLV
jgi:serine/threonine protein kinase